MEWCESRRGNMMKMQRGIGGTWLGARWLASMFLLGLTLPVHAVDANDHDRARKALEAGEILPLSTVLEKIRQETPGQVMAVELERKHNQWVYEVKVLHPGGALVKHLVDARDGKPLPRRGGDGAPNR